MRWGTGGSVHRTLEQKSNHCVLTEVKKNRHTDCTCQAEMDVGSRF